MNLIKPILLSALFGSALFGNAVLATERPPRLGEQKIIAKPPAQAKPGAEATAKKPVKRRSVRQVLDDDLRPAAPPATPPAVYSPQMTPPLSAQPVPGSPPAPVNLNCVGSTCTDANGGRFNGGVGTTLISPQGKLCNNNGITVQCF